MGEDEAKAVELAKDFLTKIKVLANSYENNEFSGLAYRLANDRDRQVRNYLLKNENGHVSTSKIKLFK